MLFFTTKAINDTQEALRVTFCNCEKGTSACVKHQNLKIALRVTFCNCEKGTSACVKHQNLKIINASCKTSWKSWKSL